MGLYHRIPRQLRANLLRYLALFFLVVLCLYVVVGIVGAADTIIKTVEDGAERNNREDGHFTVLTPLSQSQLKELEQTGAGVEAMFYMDFVQEDGSVMRVFEDRREIDLVQPDEGGLPKTAGELLVEKLYAGAHNLSVGSRVIIGGLTFTVSGTGSSPDYDSPLQNLTDMATDRHRFGTAFVSAEAYRQLRDGGQSMQSETYLYAYRLNGATTHEALRDVLKGFHVDRDTVTDKFFLELLDEAEAPKNELLDSVSVLVAGGVSLSEALAALETAGGDLAAALGALGLPPQMAAALRQYMAEVGAASDGADELLRGLYALQEEANRLADELMSQNIENLTSFLKAENNPRIDASVEDVAINKAGGILAGVIVLILFAYVISVFIVHSIDSDSEVIGTLYALGVPRGTLLRHYLVLPVVISALGGILGTLLGFSPLGVAYQMRDSSSYFSFPSPTAHYPVYLLVYGLVMPPLVALFVNWLVTRGRLAKPPLALLRKEHAKAKSGGVRIRNRGFISMFRLRQILREKRAGLAVCGGIFIALLLLILGLNCYSFIVTMQQQNEADIRYEYIVSLKYPPKEVPEGATAVYRHSLTKEIYGSELEVSILGIDADNPYFDFTPEAGEEMLTISSSMANKYHLRAGDTVILSDSMEGRSYVFTVNAVVPYSVGLYAFMDIDSMRNLFGAGEDAYNVLLANTMPDVETGRIYAVTSKTDILEYSDVFMQLMTPMVVMMVSVATVVFVIVMYLMMKMIIDRSSFGISLMKIFGFSDGEVRRLYLDGNFLTVTLSALAGVPLAKLLMDALYPRLISNVAFGPDMALLPWLYAAIFGLVFGSYFFISLLLNRRLKKVTPAEVLKQRE